MVTRQELDDERLKAEIDAQKALASKLRAEASYIRRKDALKKQKKEDFESSLYEQRIYEFAKEITEKSVNGAITTLSEWRARSADDITIRFTTPGGEVIAGFALYDYILALRAEGIRVYTVALGWAASMGGLLLQAGTKRYMAPNAHILIHEVSDQPAAGKLPDLEDAMAFLRMLERRGVAVLAERSTLSEDQISRKMKRKDWWMGTEEAIELGFADDSWPPRKGRRQK